MQQVQQHTRHPTLEHLDALVGEWETAATHPHLPGLVIHGRATFEWLDGGHFLLWRARYDHPTISNSIAILGGGPPAGLPATAMTAMTAMGAA
jgi:hypothetical protein